VSQPFIGEIRMFAGNFAPAGWAFCNGALLPISENTALFNLIGTTYGGDGQTTFALPDLRGRIPVHQGAGFDVGANGGLEQVTLTTAELPSHAHAAPAQSNAGGQPSPANGVWATVSTQTVFSSAGPTAAMNPACIGVAGGSQPHENRMPYLAMNFILSLFGIFPTQ
jgi:microcystin-dependent protein